MLKFGHHAASSLSPQCGTGIVCREDGALQTGYPVTQEPPAQGGTRAAQTLHSPADNAPCDQGFPAELMMRGLSASSQSPVLPGTSRAGTPGPHWYPSRARRRFLSPSLLAASSWKFELFAFKEGSVHPHYQCRFRVSLVNENQHEWSQLCPHLRRGYARTPGSWDLIWSENPHSQCILKTEPQSQSIGTIQILAVSG